MLSEHNVTAVVAVKDLDVAKRFYGEVLGLSADREDGGGVMFKSGSGGIYVYVSPDNAGTNRATAAAWNVDDIEGTVEELKGKGVIFEHYDMPGVERSGDVHLMGEVKGAWFKDPDGNILNLVDMSGGVAGGEPADE